MLPDVSRETKSLLIVYEQLLIKWQKSINLVSPSTLSEIDKRHFIDSQQLRDKIPLYKIVYDLGSGAGFPGMVLAITRPDLTVELFESDQRKCEFLRTVSRETKTELKINNQRVENSNHAAPDVITCRAFASLEQIFTWTKHWWQNNRHLEFWLLKGASYREEIEAASLKYGFDTDTYPSETDPTGIILHITNLRSLTKLA